MVGVRRPCPLRIPQKGIQTRMGESMNINQIPALAAVVCFAVTLLSAIGAFSANESAWTAGGLLALAVAVLAPKL